MADSRDGWRGTPNNYGWKALGGPLEDPPQPPQPQPTAGSLKKQEFLSSVLKASPEDLVEWHAGRNGHEQQRYIQVLDDMYTQWAGKKKPRRSRSAKPSRTRSQPVLAPISESGRSAEFGRTQSGFGGSLPAGSVSRSVPGGSIADLDDLESVGGGSMRSSKSAPNMAPIDVYNAKRLHEARIGAPDDNTLKRWIDTRSITPASVSTDWTSASKMTKTSQGTVMSAPCTKYTMDFRKHQRAFAVNRRKWRVPDAHEPQSQLVVDGTTEEQRLQTQFQRDFGTAEKGSTLRKETAFVGFKPEAHDFLENYLQTCHPSAKEAFTQVGRAMHTHNYVKHYSTSTARAFDINKNRVLYNPGPAQPVVMNPYRSSVPLGNLNMLEGEAVYPPVEPRPEVNMPPAYSCAYPA